MSGAGAHLGWGEGRSNATLYFCTSGHAAAAARCAAFWAKVEALERRSRYFIGIRGGSEGYDS